MQLPEQTPVLARENAELVGRTRKQAVQALQSQRLRLGHQPLQRAQALTEARREHQRAGHGERLEHEPYNECLVREIAGARPVILDEHGVDQQRHRRADHKDLDPNGHVRALERQASGVLPEEIEDAEEDGQPDDDRDDQRDQMDAKPVDGLSLELRVALGAQDDRAGGGQEIEQEQRPEVQRETPQPPLRPARPRFAQTGEVGDHRSHVTAEIDEDQGDRSQIERRLERPGEDHPELLHGEHADVNEKREPDQRGHDPRGENQPVEPLPESPCRD